MNSGSFYALGAYVLWGILPLYWKALSHVPATQLICHRILWSLITLSLFILLAGQARNFVTSVRKPGVFMSFIPASILISINWLLYIWSVNSGYIVEASLGYFINPLINVVLGVFFFSERLRPVQWFSVALAAGGVIYLGIAYGSMPWIALTLAFSFAFYGLVKKKAQLGSLFGLTLETGILSIPALFWLIWCESNGTGAFMHHSTGADFLMAGAGIMTSLPLLMFASAAIRIPLSLVGLFQYISPTLQLVIGIFVFNESFTRTRFIGFGIVWTALVIYVFEGLMHTRKRVEAG